MQYDDIRPIYYLKRWKYYEAAMYELTPRELEQAKIFFNALRNLDEDDKKYLSESYYYSIQVSNYNPKTGYYHSIIPIGDKIIAAKLGFYTEKYRHLRSVAQLRLKGEMQKIMKEISKKFILRISKKLYLIEITDEGNYLLGEKSKAKLFTDADRDLITNLYFLGFDKVPIDWNKMKSEIDYYREEAQKADGYDI